MAHQREHRYLRPLAVVAGIMAVSAALVEHWPAEETVDWRSYADAVAEARRTDRPIYLDLYAGWCGPCIEMERVTFPNDTVRTLLSKDYIPARFNIDSPEFTDSLRTAWNLRAIPTSIVLSPDGREMRRHVGFQTSTQLISWLGDSNAVTFSRWRSFEDARTVARDRGKPMLVVIAQSAKTLDNIGFFSDDSVLQTMLLQEFVPTYVPPNDPSTRWIDTLRSRAPLAYVPDGGILLVIVKRDMEITGQLPLAPWEMGDSEMILKRLRGFVASDK